MASLCSLIKTIERKNMNSVIQQNRIATLITSMTGFANAHSTLARATVDATTSGKHVMKFITLFIVSAVLILFATSATAHDELKPKHGGLIQEVNEVQYEIVAKPDQVTIYVFDHSKKMTLKNASGKLTLLTGTTKSDVMLVQDEDNKLVAKGVFKIEKGTKVVAVIKIGDKTSSVRWSLK
jgi:hypothetical protein